MSWETKPKNVGTRRPGDPADRSAQMPGVPVDRATLAILRNPDFQTLVRERTAFGWTLSILMLAVYLTFIFLVAFEQPLMAMKLGGGEISLGIVLGLCVILFAILLTGIYVARANSRFDDLTRAVRRIEKQ